jgi:hypothetical protein
MTARRIPTDHASHDQLLIAAHVAGDTSATESSQASSLLAICPDCRQAAADLAAIAAASRDVPAPKRSRDFRLTQEQALRLRRRSPLARLGQILLAPGGPARALPGALMTVGLAALLVSAVPGFPLAGAPAALDTREQVLASPTGDPAKNDTRAAAPAAPSGAPGAAPDAVQGGASASAAPNLAPPVVGDAATSLAPRQSATQLPAAYGAGGGPGSESTSGGSPEPAAPSDVAAERAAFQSPPLLVILAIILFGSGLVLLIARRLASRSIA